MQYTLEMERAICEEDLRALKAGIAALAAHRTEVFNRILIIDAEIRRLIRRGLRP